MHVMKSVFILSLLGLVFSSSTAFALMLGLSTEKLTRDAEQVVIGDVDETASEWTPDKKSIITKAVVSVHEFIKGRFVQNKIQVVFLGGQVGDIAMRVSDEPQLHKGEHVLLFLSPETQFSEGTAFRISGRAQGIYTIGDDRIARKRGFSAQAGDEQLDTIIPTDTLKEKIRTYVDEK